jgi:hypothetical protein
VIQDLLVPSFPVALKEQKVSQMMKEVHQVMMVKVVREAWMAVRVLKVSQDQKDFLVILVRREKLDQKALKVIKDHLEVMERMGLMEKRVTLE